MSRKFDRQQKVNEGIRDVIEDPMTLVYLSKQIFRKQPRWTKVPQWGRESKLVSALWIPATAWNLAWKLLMKMVLNPSLKQKRTTVTTNE